MREINEENQVPVVLQWLNPVNKRYYVIYLAKDLLDEWLLTEAWGNQCTRFGSSKNVFCQTYETGLSLIEKLKKKRLARGYRLVWPLP